MVFTFFKCVRDLCIHHISIIYIYKDNIEHYKILILPYTSFRFLKCAFLLNIYHKFNCVICVLLLYNII